MIKVSVIIPTYNRADVLPRAIESVLQQKINNLELIIVDDGSTDNTKQVVKSYADNRIKFIKFEKNQGANVARNAGIKYSTGKYLTFLDSDDEWKESKLEAQLNRSDKVNKSIIYTGVEYANNNTVIGVRKPTACGDLSDKLLYTNIVGTFSSVLLPREVIESVGLPNPELPCLQDWEWYLRLSQMYEFSAISEPLVIKHSVDGQISNDFQKKIEIYSQATETIKEYSRSSSEYRQALCHFQFGLAKSALTNNQFDYARQFFIKSIKTDPIQWRSYLYLCLCGPHFIYINNIRKLLKQYH